MCVLMYVVHGHCGPLNPDAGPHTSWDHVVGSHIFAGPDGGSVGLVGLVGSVVGFGFRGLGLFLARPGLVPVPLSLLGGGEEEGLGHLAEGGAAQVFHPNGTILPPVDTTDGAPLYPGGVGYVDDRPDDQILGTVVLLLGTLGGVGLGRGGGGWWWRSWGG